ncbi:MAG: ATP-binding cassette domain-containing protein, partial [Gammaproteobacteria bacterium]|nr:ATP-binding cassette domain-containing protein [Gammaproteobacteria bacterium]
MLLIENLHVRTDGRDILQGVSLTVERGEVHAVMGPNGSGKSTLANVIAGRPGYEVTAGTVHLDGVDLLDLEPEDRAHRGVFLAFQYPVEIPGVSNMEFLKAAVDSQHAAAGEAELCAIDF